MLVEVCKQVVIKIALGIGFRPGPPGLGASGGMCFSVELPTAQRRHWQPQPLRSRGSLIFLHGPDQAQECSSECYQVCACKEYRSELPLHIDEGASIESKHAHADRCVRQLLDAYYTSALQLQKFSLKSSVLSRTLTHCSMPGLIESDSLPIWHCDPLTL